MKTTRVTLPNGSLLRIDGADAPQVASLITNHLTLTRNVPVGSPAEADEEALPVPILNFAKDQVQTNAEADGEESALALPRTL